MEVTRTNFDTVMPQVEAAINSADFLAIDCEFTGLTSGSIINSFDSPEECYQFYRENTKDFLLIQFGLSTFRWDEKANAYKNSTYVFYIFPRQEVQGATDKIFCCQSSSLDFLRKNQFDFNKLIYEGISYLNVAEEVNVRQRIDEKQLAERSQKKTYTSSSSRIPIPDNVQFVIDEISIEVQKFLSTNEKKAIEFENLNSFQRKLIFQELEIKFKDDLYMETKTVDDKKILVVSKGLTEKERLLKLELKHKKELSSIEDAVGFSTVARLISDSKKLIVGHSIILDLLHLMNNFFYPLPEEYIQFKSLASHIFPSVIDTMNLAKSNSFKDFLSSYDLEGLFIKLSSEPFSIPKIEGENVDESYINFEVKKFHDAGFDAYITGVCLLSLYGHLKKSDVNTNEILNGTSSVLKPYFNKLFLFRTAYQGSPFINLSGKDPTPHRNHVFHMIFPKEWKRSEISDIFEPFGGLSTVAFINETSAYVSLKQHNKAESLKKCLNSLDKKCHITPFKEYKLWMKNKTNLLQKMNANQDNDVTLNEELLTLNNENLLKQHKPLKRKHDNNESDNSPEGNSPVSGSSPKISIDDCTDASLLESKPQEFLRHKTRKERKRNKTSGNFKVENVKSEAIKKPFPESDDWD